MQQQPYSPAPVYVRSSRRRSSLASVTTPQPTRADSEEHPSGVVVVVSANSDGETSAFPQATSSAALVNPLKLVSTVVSPSQPPSSRHVGLTSPLLDTHPSPHSRHSTLSNVGSHFTTMITSHVITPAVSATRFLSSRLLVKLSDNEANLLFLLSGATCVLTLCCFATEICVIITSFHTYAAYVALASLAIGRPIAGWIVSYVINPAAKVVSKGQNGEEEKEVGLIDAISDGIVVVIILFVSGVFFSICGESLLEYWRLKECWRERHVNKLHKQLRLLQSRHKGVANASSRRELEQNTLLLLRQQKKAKAAVASAMGSDKNEEGCCAALSSFSPFATESDGIIPQTEEEVVSKINTIQSDHLFSFASPKMRHVFALYCVCKCLFRIPQSALSLYEATAPLARGVNGTVTVSNSRSAEIVLFTNGAMEAAAVVLGLVVMVHKFVVDNSTSDSHIEGSGVQVGNESGGEDGEVERKSNGLPATSPDSSIAAAATTVNDTKKLCSGPALAMPLQAQPDDDEDIL